jgi:hypothetical protein
MAVSQPAIPRRRRSWRGWQFVGPFMLIFALVFLAPIVYSIYLSLYRNQLIGGNSFVGLDNYQRLLQDSQFWSSFGRVALFLCIQVPIMLILALLVALAIDSGRLYGKAFFRVSIFLPYAVPAVVATLMWGFIYGDQFGLVGNINDAFHTTLPNPLSPHLALASIGNIVTWESSRRSSCPRSAARWSSRRSSRSSAASSSSPSRSSCSRWRPTRSPRTSRRTCTPTSCPSRVSSTTTPPPSPSSWA